MNEGRGTWQLNFIFPVLLIFLSFFSFSSLILLIFFLSLSFSHVLSLHFSLQFWLSTHVSTHPVLLYLSLFTCLSLSASFHQPKKITLLTYKKSFRWQMYHNSYNFSFSLSLSSVITIHPTTNRRRVTSYIEIGLHVPIDTTHDQSPTLLDNSKVYFFL